MSQTDVDDTDDPYLPSPGDLALPAHDSTVTRLQVSGWVPRLGDVQVYTVLLEPTTDPRPFARSMVEALRSQQLQPGPPHWHPGDVILYRFRDTPGAWTYTYVVESVLPWRTSGSRSLTSVQLNQAWYEHRAVLVMSSGRLTTPATSCVHAQHCLINHYPDSPEE